MVTQQITSPGPAPSVCPHSPALLTWWLESVRTDFLLPEELSTDPCQLLPQEQSPHSALLGPHLLLLAKEVVRLLPRLLSAPAFSQGGYLSIHKHPEAEAGMMPDTKEFVTSDPFLLWLLSCHTPRKDRS